jgi:hypothetical protein
MPYVMYLTRKREIPGNSNKTTVRMVSLMRKGITPCSFQP